MTSAIAMKYRIIDRIRGQIAEGKLDFEHLGLWRGKLGYAIFLLEVDRIAKFRNNEDFRFLAEALVEDVCVNLEEDIGDDLQGGLSGIGVGIEYLVQSGFFSADTNGVLIDIDRNIFARLVYQKNGSPGLGNLLGYGFYLLMRCNSQHADDYTLATVSVKCQLLRVIDDIENEVNRLPIGLGSLTEEDIWCVPATIFFLSEFQFLNIYPTKVIRVINKLVDEISRGGLVDAYYLILLYAALQHFKARTSLKVRGLNNVLLTIYRYLDTNFQSVIRRMTFNKSGLSLVFFLSFVDERCNDPFVNKLLIGILRNFNGQVQHLLDSRRDNHPFDLTMFLFFVLKYPVVFND